MAERCKGTNRHGQPCQAWPLKGTEHCSAHPDSLAPDGVRFGSPEQAAAAGALGGAAGRHPRVVDIMRERVEAAADEILDAYFRVLREAMLYGTQQRSGEIVVSDHPDIGARMAAAEKLLDRVYGKPKQSTEITGPDDGPVTASFVLAPAAREVIAGVLRGRPATRKE